MKKAAVIPVMTLFSVVLLASCRLPDFPPKVPDYYDTLPGTLEEGFFYARDTTNNLFYVVEAERVYDGSGKCEIWAEKGSGITPEVAEEIAREYDDVIRPRIVDAFSEKNFTVDYDGEEYEFKDILDYANWLVNRDDGKLTILLLDIKDGYKDQNDSYVAGYFYSGNFLQKGKNKIGNNIYCSNGRDMIYVDTDPGWKNNRTEVYATFAHELQHLVNFATYVRLSEEGLKEESYTDVWVNEGLSAYAEYLYLEDHPQDKRAWLSDSRNTIKTGNNFFVWDNYRDKPLAILDDYATVYLFFQWLYLQAAPELQSRIFRDISHSKYSDYHAVTSVVGNNWETLLRNWLAANYYPQNTVYGYKGDPDLQSIININPIYVAGNEISLYPGEGVYSIINGSYSAVNAGNIRYAGLTAHTATVDVSPPYSGDALLTFNANDVNANVPELRETGSLTGVSSSVTISRTAAENSRSGKWTRPYVIDAQDLLGRDQDVPIRRLRR
jgi:hypothetical protein